MHITPSLNKSFDDIVNDLFTLITLTLGMELYASSSGQIARYAPNHAVALDAKQVGKRLTIFPHAMLNQITASQWPTVLTMNEEPIQIPASASLDLGILERPLFAFGQSMFVSYFVRERPQIAAKHGIPPSSWPADWNFARVVRNALAHGKKVFIDNPKAAPVTWHGLTYTPADNGKKVCPWISGVETRSIYSQT